MDLLIVDDHTLLAQALSMLVQARHPTVRPALCGTLAEGLARGQAMGGRMLVLLDLGLPDARGLEAVSQVREALPEAPVVVMSADDRPETIAQAIELGACGFVPKTADLPQLERALAQALQGGITLPASLLGTVGAALQVPDDHMLNESASDGAPFSAQPDRGTGTATDPASPRLTPRQTEVLGLLVQGLSNKLICRRLGLSESAVKAHLEAVYRRLGVNSRTQAVVAAARLGLRMPSPEADPAAGA